MQILFDPEEQLFHLQNKHTSYVMKVTEEGYLAHLYWGRKLRSSSTAHLLKMIDRPFSPNCNPENPAFSLDTLPQEYPVYGHGDFRVPALEAIFADGTSVVDLRYRNHRILEGKPALAGLPMIYTESPHEALTLEIDLFDPVQELQVTLLYTVFSQIGVITRSARLYNAGQQPIQLTRALSMSLDLPCSSWDMMQLSGAWGRERHLVRRPVVPGLQAVESRRGASSHHQNPFLALMASDARDTHGEVMAVNLVYSGNFLALAEQDSLQQTRLQIGINPADFSWLLEPGEIFQTPEAVLVYSAEGLDGMTEIFHNAYRERLCRGLHRHQPRPILINNWEATYFAFDEEKLLQLAEEAGQLGIELFVLDDGWFGQRDNDKTSLGDWRVNLKKLPHGLAGLAESIAEKGMKFGLWFEPEMVSPESQLFREHPDWCLHVPGRRSSTGRHQYVLDFSRKDVCDFIVHSVSEILSSAPIQYVKWDMNRHMTEIGSACLPVERQRETAHRYMLGLYAVMETLTTRFPEVLFESCSGGGGRFDPGMLYYMPQTWTSDNTDAIERLYIQYGTALVYPPITMGAHVSAVPNHQVQRITPLATRGIVAMGGNFGYELDITKLTNEEKNIVAEQVETYKQIRETVQFGRYFALANPFEGDFYAWMFVSQNRQQAVVSCVTKLQQANHAIHRLRLKGLDAEAQYRVELVQGMSYESDIYGGDELMYAGIAIPYFTTDFQSCMWKLSKLNA
ncbi:alpha-galactosidase [Alicyclobacillus tolerans]|uniref:Alpha-galactosidase n=1 Tax=Alicyclobacillus tolerans TaxID=90970 RepID=A0A1M6TYZ1_9BACL|nr:alpha-galactosidase [Alicyclobacillus montanus]SHK62177.1 alpha-galactosidase [Alicyclobacillus montanus]